MIRFATPFIFTDKSNATRDKIFPQFGETANQCTVFCTILQKTKFLFNGVIVGDGSSHYNVRVPIDVLGDRMHRDVGTEIQRSLKTKKMQE